jgi:adenosylcobinamide-GDP ribazoletransferase
VDGLRLALVFLTRVPVGRVTRPELARAVPWFPVAGALVGLVVGAVTLGVDAWAGAVPGAAVGVLTGVLVTGAFHEDGLADVADAFAGGWTVGDRLRILNDPLHGSYGVAALCGSIVARVGAMSALVAVSGWWAVGAAVAGHALGRSAAVALMLTVPVATPDGLGAAYARELRTGAGIVGILTGVGIAAVAVGPWVAAAVAGAAGAALAVARLARRKIGGITGDVLGACEQVTEIVVLVILAGAAARSSLWWR